MASMTEDVSVAVDAERAWKALRDVGRAHVLFAPVLVNGSIAGEVRTVTFANGMVAQERILDIDDQQRRVAYAALNVPGMEYHHASMQVIEDGPDRCRFVWITDVLPATVVDGHPPADHPGRPGAEEEPRVGRRLADRTAIRPRPPPQQTFGGVVPSKLAIACMAMPDIDTDARMLDRELKKGSAELIILSIVEPRARHGYEISKLIEERSEGQLKFHVASLYPLLYRLEERGWLQGRWVEKAGERRRRFYTLTAEGRRVLARQRETWKNFVKAMGLVTGVDHA